MIVIYKKDLLNCEPSYTVAFDFTAEHYLVQDSSYTTYLEC